MQSEESKVQKKLIELKARVGDLARIRNVLTKCEAKHIGTFHQVDTYYVVPIGRLKLREVEGKREASLIYYERENVANPKKSSVFILNIPQPQTFKQILNRIARIKVVVDKIREIYFFKGVQIHLDKVRRLGYFIEFELATSVDSKQQEKDVSKLEKLRHQFSITTQNLEKLSYSDLI